MRYFEYLREAYEALLRNKTRSLLTLLGMIIGVAAVDSVYGLSVGAAKAIDATIASGNNPNLTIGVDSKQADPAAAALSYDDAARVAAGAAGSVERVIPFYSISFNSRRYRVRSGDAEVTAFGFSWQADDANLELLAGTGFSRDQVASAQRVCLLSQDLAQHLFAGSAAAVGRTLTIGGSRFTVEGVPDPDKGTAANYFGGSYYFVLPYTTFHDFVPGPVDGLYVWLRSPAQEATARQAILLTLAHLHGPRAAYTVTSTRQQLDQTRRVINVIAASLTAIGAISLFVAGIGIMNIMLVAVTERTREIGIRKSIGARRSEIVIQFLTESGFLAILGGAAGLLLSVGVIALTTSALVEKIGAIAVPWPSVVAYAFLFALGVGLSFGVYPAARASRLDPVEALRS